MAIDALLDALEREADGEAAAILARAGEQAAALRAGADTRRIASLDQALAERATLVRERSEGARASARRATRETALRARDACLTTLFADAAEALPIELASRELALAGLAREALRYLPDDDAVLRAEPAAADRLRAILAGAPGVRIVSDAGVGAGVLGESGDRHVVVDNTVAARLARLRPRIAVELVRRLEEGS